MAEGQTTVTEPALSRDHSERMLQAFGAELISDPETNSVTVWVPLNCGQTVVPGDISSAAFWLVAGAIVGSELLIENVGVNPTDGYFRSPINDGSRHSARKSAGCCR